MPKQRLVWVLAGCLLLLASVAALHLLFPPNRITVANCERVKVGMTEAEVCGILGEPVCRQTDGHFMTPDGAEYLTWSDYGIVLTVAFDAEGRVLGGSLIVSRDKPPPLLDRLRARLGW